MAYVFFHAGRLMAIAWHNSPLNTGSPPLDTDKPQLVPKLAKLGRAWANLGQ